MLLIAFALIAPQLDDGYGQAAIHGLKIVALAVVAHGVMGMAKKLCADRLTASIGALAAGFVLLFPGAWMQVAVVAVAALVTALSARQVADKAVSIPSSHSPGLGTLLITIALLLLFSPLLAALTQSQSLLFVDAFYRSGALVFGGGHVVLPLLEEAVVGPGWVSDEAFLSRLRRHPGGAGATVFIRRLFGFCFQCLMTGSLGRAGGHHRPLCPWLLLGRRVVTPLVKTGCHALGRTWR